MFPIYQPYPEVYYVEDHTPALTASPCKWYQDLDEVGGEVYCQTPAVWLVIAGVGIATLAVMLSKR